MPSVLFPHSTQALHARRRCKTSRGTFVAPAEVLRDNVAWLNASSDAVGRKMLGTKRRRALEAAKAASPAQLPPEAQSGAEQGRGGGPTA